MSGSNRTKIARRRKYFTGESYQHALHEMQQWRAGQPAIPLAANDAQQFAESTVLHRLLLGARAQWPTHAVPQCPLFVSAVHLSLSAPRIEVPFGAGQAFGAALVARQDSGAGQPLADGIVIRCSPTDSSLLVVQHSPQGGRIDIRCRWSDLRKAVGADPSVSAPSGQVLRFEGRPHRISGDDRAVLSSLFRRIALFVSEEPLAWLFAWHEWVMRGRIGPMPVLPHDLVRDLADDRLGLPVMQRAVLGIEESLVLSAGARHDTETATGGSPGVRETAPASATAAPVPAAAHSSPGGQQPSPGRRYDHLAVTVLRFDPAHQIGREFYVMRMPARWRQALEQVRLNVLGDRARMARSSLHEALSVLLPGCAMALPDAGGGDDPGWLYADHPIDPAVVLAAVTAWVRTQPVSMQQIEHTTAQLSIDNLAWTPTSVDGNLPLPQLMRLIPMIVAAQLARSPYPTAVGTLRFRTCLTVSGVELISWPPEHLDDQMPFSVTIGVSAQTVPGGNEPLVHLAFGVRRWAHTLARLRAGQKYSVFLDPAGRSLDGALPPDRLVSARISLRRANQDPIGSWLPHWDDTIADVLEQAGVLDRLPDPRQIVSEPLAMLQGGAAGAALTFREGMGWTKATAGLSVADRHPLMAWAASQLAPHLQPVEPLPRHRHAQYPGLSTTLHAAITPDVLSATIGRQLTIELITADALTAQDALDHLSTRFSVAFPPLDQIDGSVLVAFGPVTINVRRPSDVSANALMKLSSRRSPGPGTDTERLREKLGSASTPTVTLIQTTDHHWGDDALAKLRAALAGTGRLSRFMTLTSGPPRTTGQSAGQTNLDGNRKQVGYAIDDLLRDLGVRPLPLPAPTNLNPPAVLAIWDARHGGLGARRRPMPFAVLCDPTGQQVRVRTPGTPWQPLHIGQLELRSDDIFADRASRDGVARFLREVIDTAVADYPDTLLLTHAQNLRSTWKFLTNRQISVDALDFGTGGTVPITNWPGLRHVRLRTAEGGETPQCYGINGDRLGHTAGLWRHLSPRLFGSTTSKPAIHASALSGVSKLTSLHHNGKLNEPNPRAAVWNAEFVELFVAGVQASDRPEEWAALVHELRSALPYANWATTLPWPLHLARQIGDQLRSASD